MHPKIFGEVLWTVSRSPPPPSFLFFLAYTASFSRAPDPSLRVLLPHAMAASHPEMFQPSNADENELLKLVENCFLPDHAVLQ
jgi:hypothetical protein